MWKPLLVRFRMALVGVLCSVASVEAQITPIYTFNQRTVAESAKVNANFALLANALNRTGGTITGNIAVTSGVTIDGVDISVALAQNVGPTASPSFLGLTITGTGASALDVAGGINAGSGNVGIIGTDGRIPALSSTYFTSLSGAYLTDVALLGTANTFTARNDFYTYTETRATPSISAGSLTLDLATATFFGPVALNANISTLTLSNAPASGKLGAFTVAFQADGTLRTITWPASVKWPGGAAPTMTSTNGKIDVITLITVDGCTSYLGFVAGQSF